MPRLLQHSFLLISGFILLLFTACATTAPVQEMSNARQTIQAAVEAGAETHAPDELANARKLLEEASRELEEGNYLLARDYALQAKQHAMQARQAALIKAHQKE
jgi:uncharacterized membrane protein YccC